MIIFSGGTGTPKLLDGLMRTMDEEEITVVVNTAEDLWVSGNLVTPDIDTVLYLFAGMIDRDKWWGIAGDTFRTFNAMKDCGYDEKMMLGDRDRATHIMRSDMIRNGATLSEAIANLCSRFGIKANILPMSDNPVSTMIRTPQGWMHYQDFWIKHKGKPDVLEVKMVGIGEASVSPAVMEKLREDSDVLIGPSNPITSIGPIISLDGMPEILKSKNVVAISPIIGNEPVSGPAGKLMNACGYGISSDEVARCYHDFLDVFVTDIREPQFCNSFESMACSVVKTDTMMSSVDISIQLAGYVKNLFESLQ
ncbi:2-phospho-L-lactate transferase [Methanohalophilus sp. RSK]|uniref:2-phospho-L-lactate transferase n=1 Tax=Methanohalophilus sp. RSK TaxID=2485783 RepID=UPI000F43DA02|nr:2-phospho-L-lactate transferase [Methanohalophilus sp. RSK]RNI13944.1 2-phospho-L-lactate transferase [Methanohalophilus sp. RSK]